MNRRVLRTLEYNKIIDKLVENAVSPMAKEIASELMPYDDVETVITKQTETTEAADMLVRKSTIPLGGMKDIRASLKKVKIGSVLRIVELLHIADTLYVFNKLNKYYNEDDKMSNRYKNIEGLFENIVVLNDLEKEINRCIISEEEIADSASTELASIRKQISVSQNRVKEKLNGIISSASNKTMLQDAVVTIRNGRYCVPVKQEYRGQFKGIVHDRSATGSTLFIEPMPIVDLNNKIKELELKEKEEIEKILRVLTGLVAESSDIVKANLELATEIDTIFARAKLSKDMDGVAPKYNEDLYMNIKKGRHPLLKKEEAVPNDIRLGGEFSTLIITGPNTGGKTVTLKTVGLLSLMGQAGLHIPAFDGSELCMFDEVYADIGDEQSIEQSLSTFSSHMKNIVNIMEGVTANSLALFDELGAGTDPIEGAALATAILKKLNVFGIRTVATTHYSELKNYALTAEGVENASCEFDVKTLRPTYKLLIGVPGKSNAFEISRKLGLSDEIINESKTLINTDDIKLEDVIAKLEYETKEAEKEKDLAEKYRKEIEELKVKLSEKNDKAIQNRDKILTEAKEKALEIYKKAKEEADEMIRDLQKQAKDAKQSLNSKSLELGREQLGKTIKGIQGDLTKDVFKPSKVNKNPIKNLKLGDEVFVSSLNQDGVVDTLPDSKGELYVQVGIMRMKVRLEAIFPKEDKSKDKVTKKFDKRNASSIRKEKAQEVVPEINILGMYTEEGVQEVDKFLDDSVLSNIEKIRIVHGKGTGKLRAAVHQYLKRDKRVKSYRLGVYGEGETGVTIVELR